MAEQSSRWIDAPALRWTPRVPLRFEPLLESAIPRDEIDFEPVFVAGVMEPAPDRDIPENIISGDIIDVVPANDDPAPATAETPFPETRVFWDGRIGPDAAIVPPPAVAATQQIFGHASRHVPVRLGIGLAQGLALLILAQSRSLDLLPGNDPYLFASLTLYCMFAPLVLLQGLGTIPARPLIAWTGSASLLLVALGFYHRWRTASPDPGHSGFVLALLVALFLFVGQALVIAATRTNSDRESRYRRCFESAWPLAIQILFCALVTALCWGLFGATIGLLRSETVRIELLEMPFLALANAAAMCLATPRLLAGLQRATLRLLTLSLPLLAASGTLWLLAVLTGLVPPMLAIAMALAVGLVLTINASYRLGPSAARPRWRRPGEFCGILLLGPVTALAGFALGARVAQYGWTDKRILAAAALILLGGYAASYLVAALIALGGGGWLKRIETANLFLAVAVLALIAALASPLADPVRLAVASQSLRAEKGLVAPEAFDFAWLRYDGLRFGREALEKMAAGKNSPALARGAFTTLAETRGASRPAPTEIGANISVRPALDGHAAQLPAALVDRDWSKVTTPGVPPCLTSVALSCDAYFVDLDGDGRDEIVLVYGNDRSWWGAVMKEGTPAAGNEGWFVAGALHAPACVGSLSALRAGHYQAAAPQAGWRDLVVGGLRLAVTPNGATPVDEISSSRACPAS